MCMCSKGLSNLVDVCPWTKNIENINNQLKYTVIQCEKGTVTTLEIFFEGHRGSCKFSNFLFFNIARLLRPSRVRIYSTKHVIESALTTMMS